MKQSNGLSCGKQYAYEKSLSISDEIFNRKDRDFFESLTINFPVNKER